MSQRPGIQITTQHPVDGGESPNRYLPWVSMHIRAYWPARTDINEVRGALGQAFNEAWDAINQKFGVSDEDEVFM